MQYYIDDKIAIAEIRGFLAKHNLAQLEYPEVPALRQEYAEKFVHAIKRRGDQLICGAVIGVSYEGFWDFDVITILRTEDVFDLIREMYLYRAYQENPSGRKIRWRINGRTQPPLDSCKVAFSKTTIERLNEIL